ncbi:MAG TPA: ATP-dependent Clp protease ATP-binding subunit [Polyangiaceae bacterium]|jgi:ATP-dependent Clp protease ATP-binding subunit ClpC|nr:ATP-dependent Clp protease ATP-binding subunit [Polyangiaceae bacterium]
MTGSRESELASLRKLAEDLAKGRGERVTTGHLLAAIASHAGASAELLKERRLDAEVLLKAARILTDDHTDAVSRAFQRTRELAARSPTRDASGIHLLFALCQERNTAAYRAITQCGSDVTKLRMAAMQLAMGIVGPRRMPAATQLTLPPSSTKSLAPVRLAPSVASLSSIGSASSIAPPIAATPAPQPPPRPKRQRHPQPAPSASPAAGQLDRFELDPKRFPTLASIGRNLTAQAARGELDPVLGREEEIDRTLDVLAKRHGNCPCLVGGAGVGKTSVVRGLAQRVADGAGGSLDDRVVVEIDAASLLAGTGVRGALAERMAQIKGEVARSEGRVVLFFDEIHAILGADDEAAAELKVSLGRGELACIGATTAEDFKRVVLADAGLARRLTAIEVAELAPDEAVLALERVAPAFEKHHGVRFAPEAIAAAVAWSARYMPDRALPDKAVSVLDLAGARARRRGERDLGRDRVAEVLSETCGVPVERLLEQDGARMLRLEELMAKRIVGHGEALERIARVLRRNASGFRSRRPIGSFLLLGPTGVGKTETAKAIAECLFHSPHAMTRLDFSEYAEAHAISRLVGAPPGYIGHDGGGQLTEAVRKRPYQVLLLDEIEKAHRDVLEAFLQVFDEGHLTDGRGRTVDFTNVVIVLTSNLGADVARPVTRGRIGFGGRSNEDREAANAAAYAEALCAAARAGLPPELYNRIDEVLAFAPLGRADVAEVARRLLRALGEDLEGARGIALDVSEAAIGALLDEGGFDAELGARPMRRAIGRLVEAPIAEMILRGEIDRGDVALVDAENGKVAVDAVRRRASGARALA